MSSAKPPREEMSSAVPHRPLLTVEETAERLRVSPKTVRRFIDGGVVPALRVGGSIRVDEGELEDWLYDEAPAAPPRPEAPAGRRSEEVAPAFELRPPAGAER
jgi:excisionase family DNA binding protein